MALQPGVWGGYSPQSLTQGERQTLWQHFGHSGEAPVGYGGEGGGAVSGAGAVSDPIALAKQMYELQQQFKQPAITTLEAGRTQIPQIFQPQRAAIGAEKEPLEQRYQALLKDITGQTELAYAQEYGKRGIPLSSGAYQMALGKALSPQIEKIGLEKETGLRGLEGLLTQLTTGEAQAGLDLNSAIAAIQAATGTDATTAALNLYQYQQQAQQQATQTALQRWIAEQQQAQLEWKKPYEERMYEYELGKPYYKPEVAPTEPTPFPTFGGQQIISGIPTAAGYASYIGGR